VAIGGAVGAVFRYAVLGLVQTGNTVFPWGTLVVNVVGSFLIGLLWAFFDQGAISPNMRTFLFIGVLGGFTTFSAFSLETMNLIRDSERTMALFNVMLSVLAPIVFAFAGLLGAKYMISLFK
jgi:CrcB protein